MTSIQFQPWSGRDTFETEATAENGRWLSLYVGPVRDCPWSRWLYTVDTCENTSEHDLRHIAVGIAYSPDTAKTEAEAAARCWLRPTPRLEAIN